jgi:hypothetical protein
MSFNVQSSLVRQAVGADSPGGFAGQKVSRKNNYSFAQINRKATIKLEALSVQRKTDS